MMQKDPDAKEAGRNRTKMGKDPDGKDTDRDFGRFESEQLNLKSKPCYFEILLHSHFFIHTYS